MRRPLRRRLPAHRAAAGPDRGSPAGPRERHRAQVGLSTEEFLAIEGPKHLLNRVGQRGEVAEAILFLASDAASFITGTHLMVDGGYTVR